MNNGTYVLSMLGTNFAIGVLNAMSEDLYIAEHLKNLYILAAIAFVVLAFYIAIQRLTALNRTPWWSLIIVIPFGWLVIACLSENRRVA